MEERRQHNIGQQDSAFVISLGSQTQPTVKDNSLQQSFLQYKKKRQEAIQLAKLNKEKRLQAKYTEKYKQDLRHKFVEQAKKYFGVPYAQRYWKKDEAEYNADLFLDCCGLVRRIVRDLKEEFGFEFGPWNQAYQYDTLPLTVESAASMKPGDLVFITATYYNPKSKRQKHDVVHVEIWLGDGEKTIGARWQRGKVQVHDSYMFEAKSYHTPTYIFKSIDTWLSGECRSHCSEHAWKLPSQFIPSHKSIFYSDGGCTDRHEPRISDENASDTEGDGTKYSMLYDSVTGWIVVGSLSDVTNADPAECDIVSSHSDSAECDIVSSHSDTAVSSTDYTTHSNGMDMGEGNAGNITDMKVVNTAVDGTESIELKSPRSKTKKSRKAQHNARIRFLSLPTNGMASYQICGGNGGPLVDAYLNSLGWKKIPDKQNFNWKLKWIEVNSQVNYGAFRDGEQLVNRIPNCSLLTNKLGLYNSLSEYSRVVGALKGDRVRLKMNDFVPETYRIDQLKDRETFLEVYKDGEIWICKPTGLNQGKGIFLIRSREQIDKMLAEREQRKQARRTKPLMPLIVQRYIERPLLVERKKFDIRAYMMIPSTLPFIVMYHRGYVRVTCEEYNLDSLDLSTHLTNQFVQKKVENYKDVKEDTVWSMDKFNQYVNETFQEEKGIDTDWVLNYFEKQIKSIMKYCFNSVKHKLQSRLGLFDIYGLDFMIDENMKIWLIEINVNPAMHVNCEVLKETLPGILAGTVDLALECFEKAKKNQPLLPLQNIGTFHMLFNACPKSAGGQANIPTQTNSSTSDTQSNPANTGASSQVTLSVHKTNQLPARTRSTRQSFSPSKDQGWGYRNRSPVKSSKDVGDSQARGSISSGVNKPAASPITGTNYIKNNIANLGTIANRSRRSRVSRVDTKYAGVVCAEDLDPAVNNDNGPVVEPQPNAADSNGEETMEIGVVQENGTNKAGEDSTTHYHKPLANSAPVGPQQVSARAREVPSGNPSQVERNSSGLSTRTRLAANHRKPAAGSEFREPAFPTGLEDTRTDTPRVKRVQTKNSITATFIYNQIRRGHFSNNANSWICTTHEGAGGDKSSGHVPAGLPSNIASGRRAISFSYPTFDGPRSLRPWQSSHPG